MRKIVVTEFISLDGVIEDPGGAEDYQHGGWTFQFNDDEGMAFKLQEVFDHDAQLLGRVTYEGFAKAWPDMQDDAGFADKMNSMKKYVVSSTLTDPTWSNSEVLGPDLKAEIERIKGEDGGDILVAGSAQLVQGLLGARPRRRAAADDVPDRPRRGGKTLWGQQDTPLPLTLAGAQPLGSGTVILTYRRP